MLPRGRIGQFGQTPPAAVAAANRHCPARRAGAHHSRLPETASAPRGNRAFCPGFFMIHAFIYILSVVAVNWAFTVVPAVQLPGGEFWPPVALVVGFVFVIRDFAQRAIGHWVLAAMLLGGAISWVMASREVALASVCAFLISELVDWGVYTFTGRTFSQRVLLSSALSTPIDSVVFMYMMKMFSPTSVALMTASKMLGALVVFLLIRRRERAAA